MKNYLKHLMLFVLLVSCSRQEDFSVNPEIAILGKWKLIELGASLDNMVESNDPGYYEFIDSTSVKYYPSENNLEVYSINDYSIDDTYLNFYQYYIDEGEVDTIVEKFFYEFRPDNTLLLNFDQLALTNYFVYKKLK